MVKLGLLLLVTIQVSITNAYQKGHMEDIVNDMKVDMEELKECLAMTKDELLLTKEDLLAKDLSIKKLEAKTDQLEINLNAKDVSIQILKEQNHQLEVIMKDKEDSIQNLESDVSFLKDPPYMFVCSNQIATTVVSQTITYSSLLYFSTNVD